MFLKASACSISIRWSIWALITSILSNLHWFHNTLSIKTCFMNNVKDAAKVDVFVCLRNSEFSLELRQHVQMASVTWVLLIIIFPKDDIVRWINLLLIKVRFVFKWGNVMMERMNEAILWLRDIIVILIRWIWRF